MPSNSVAPKNCQNPAIICTERAIVYKNRMFRAAALVDSRPKTGPTGSSVHKPSHGKTECSHPKHDAGGANLAADREGHLQVVVVPRCLELRANARCRTGSFIPARFSTMSSTMRKGSQRQRRDDICTRFNIGGTWPTVLKRSRGRSFKARNCPQDQSCLSRSPSSLPQVPGQSSGPIRARLVAGKKQSEGRRRQRLRDRRCEQPPS